MRISSSTAMNSFIFHQQRLSGDMVRLQQEIITQKSVNIPSDNPLSASRILKFVETEQRQEQVLENLQFASGFMNEADVALEDVHGLLDRAKELTLASVNSIALPDEREAAITELNSISDTLVRIANKTHLGMYVFGGRELDHPPVERALGGVQYTGDTGHLTSRMAIDSHEAFTLTADDVFGMLSDRVVGADLSPALTLETRLQDVDGAAGQGIRLGTVRFQEDGAAGTYSADLSGATSIGQVIERINDAARAAGSTTEASLKSDGSGLLITPGAGLKVSALDNGDTAIDLGIVSETFSTSTIDGLNLNRRLMETTLVSDLMNGAGLDLTGNMIIKSGGGQSEVDLSAATTVQDMLQLINRSGIGVRAEIDADGQAIAVRNEVSGQLMSIGESTGSLAATLGLRTMNSDTPLDDLNGGRGILSATEGQDDLRLSARDGGSFTVNLDGALTVQDVLDAINTAAADSGVSLSADLATAGGGMVLTDTSSGTGNIGITGLDGFDISELGLDVEITAGSATVAGTDVGAARVDGMFTVLEELRAAIQTGSTQGMTDAGGQLDEVMTRISRVQGQLGAQVRDIELRIDQTQQAVDATNALRADIEGVSIEEALVQFQAVQNALQASLLTGGQSLNLSLLNFLG